MGIRTDLAVEFMADESKSFEGFTVDKYSEGLINIIDVEILNSASAKKIGKPIGRYITLECNSGLNIFEHDELKLVVSKKLKDLLGEITGTVLVVGIGNITITPDALGPKTAENVMATRHITSEFAKKYGLDGIKKVAVISPGVLGQTGMEAKELIEGAAERVKPDTIIIIDALAARQVSRLGNTVQLSNSGVSPGSGVSNARAELSEKTLGVRCITIGVPTVVDASTLVYDLSGVSNKEHESLIVTPRDIDQLIEKASKTIGYSLNSVLQPNLEGIFYS